MHLEPPLLNIYPTNVPSLEGCEREIQNLNFAVSALQRGKQTLGTEWGISDFHQEVDIFRICAGSVVYGWHGPPTISNEAAPCLLSNDVSVKPFVLSPWIKRSIYKPCLKDKSDWIDQQHDGHYWRTWRWSVSDDRDQVVRNPDIVLLKGLIYRIAYVHSFKIQSVNVSRGEWWDLRSRRFGALHATCSTGNSISPVSHPL